MPKLVGYIHLVPGTCHYTHGPRRAVWNLGDGTYHSCLPDTGPGSWFGFIEDSIDDLRRRYGAATYRPACPRRGGVLC